MGPPVKRTPDVLRERALEASTCSAASVRRKEGTLPQEQVEVKTEKRDKRGMRFDVQVVRATK